MLVSRRVVFKIIDSKTAIRLQAYFGAGEDELNFLKKQSSWRKLILGRTTILGGTEHNVPPVNS